MIFRNCFLVVGHAKQATLFVVVLLFLVIPLFLGCTAKPSDVPEIFPCSVTVTNGTTPISGVTVILTPETQGRDWSTSGVTDSSGVAPIRTFRGKWSGNGVPPENYIVVLQKPPHYVPSKTREEVDAMEVNEYEKYARAEERRFLSLPREVPVSLADFSKSDIKITVSDKGSQGTTIDVSKYGTEK